MTKKMDRNQGGVPKHNAPTTEGKCPHCKKHVQSLEHHIRDKHRTLM